MKLRCDPYQVFRCSKTPAGIYARKKWLGEAQALQWEPDFQETVNALLADQAPDGCWRNETAATIRDLFGLHLIVRSSNAQIESALAWLLEKIEIQTDKIQVSAEDVAAVNDLTGLPYETQNRDGTWSLSEPEWNTFLAIHALKNKGFL